MTLKELLSYISLTTLLLMFLFFCGTLYIISYWTTFDFDITNYIELFDIPKSFVFPLATGLGVSFLSLLAQGLLRTSASPAESITSKTINNKELGVVKIIRLFNPNVISLVTLAICMSAYKPYSEWIVITAGLSMGIWSFRVVNNSSRVSQLIPDKKLRLFFSVLIVFIPVYSCCKGKLDSIAIWKNRNYYTITNVVSSEPKAIFAGLIGKKLLGKLGGNIVVTDSANSNVIVVNLTDVDIIQYRFQRSAGLLME
jgi:hypothetical protein